MQNLTYVQAKFSCLQLFRLFLGFAGGFMSTPQSGGALRADSNPSGSGARRRAGRNLDGSGPSLSPRVAAVLRDEKKNCVLTDQQRFPIVTEMLNHGIPARAACAFAFVCMQAALEWACDDLSEDDAVRLAQP